MRSTPDTTIDYSVNKTASFMVIIDEQGVPANYTYEWYYDGELVEDSNTINYVADNLSLGSHTVYCTVTNSAGTVNSRIATLTVVSLPTLNSSYLADVTVVESASGNATFRVDISEEGYPTNYTYQWYKNNIAIAGATSSSYTATGLSTAGTYNIHCAVTNAAGTRNSRTATLLVASLPVLNSSYPTNAIVAASSSANKTFSVSISTAGYPNSYTYQWYKDGSAVSGATGSSYNFTSLSAVGTYNIYCAVTNAAGTVNSRTATLLVGKTPVLNSSYPANASVVESANGNTTVSVSISTAGYPTSYTYQWYKNGSAVSGATSSSYTVTGLTTAGTHTVYCKVTNTIGSVNSRTATITVTSSQPTYTYSGSHELIKDGTYGWKLKLYTTGNLKFTSFGTGSGSIDVFLVGGGGGLVSNPNTYRTGGTGGSGIVVIRNAR